MKIKTTLSVVIRILLWLIMLIGGAIYAINKDLGNLLFSTLWFHIVCATIGFFILILAFRAAASGGRELAKKGRSKHIPRLETDQLVTSGIYSCMRHPMLLGLTFLPLGWGLLLGSPTFITTVAPIEMIFIIIMVIVFEEREVVQKFGDKYKQYQKKVPMISFKIDCLKQLFSKN